MFPRFILIFAFLNNLFSRRKKQALRVKRKLREKMKLNIVIPGDRIVAVDDIELFNLKTVSSQIRQVRSLISTFCLKYLSSAFD